MSEEQNVSLEIDAGQLGALLARVATQGRQLADGKAVFFLQPASLTVEWAGASETLAAKGNGEVCVSVPLSVVIGLSRMLVGSGIATVAVEGQRIRVSRLGFGCERLARRPPQLLGADAGPLDVLMLGYGDDRSRLEESGLAAEVERMRERAGKSVERAATHLDWLGIDEPTLLGWVESHLKGRARGR